MRGVVRLGESGPVWAPRPLRDQCVRKAVRKKGRFERDGRIRGLWPWGRKWPLRGQGVRKTVRKKERFERGGQIGGIWPWRDHGH